MLTLFDLIGSIVEFKQSTAEGTGANDYVQGSAVDQYNVLFGELGRSAARSGGFDVIVIHDQNARGPCLTVVFPDSDGGFHKEVHACICVCVYAVCVCNV